MLDEPERVEGMRGGGGAREWKSDACFYEGVILEGVRGAWGCVGRFGAD